MAFEEGFRCLREVYKRARGILGYVIAAPKVGERFTEFYILGPEGKAEGYPKELVLGEEAKVIVDGITNL